jgi:hypothetical protein
VISRVEVGSPAGESDRGGLTYKFRLGEGMDSALRGIESDFKYIVSFNGKTCKGRV